MSIIVADASPLIAFATIRQLELLRALYQQVLIPEAVKQELRLDSGMPGAKRLRQAIKEGWLISRHYDDTTESCQRLQQILDKGETEAILLAEFLSSDNKYRFLLIDERKGRKIALKRGLSIAGTGAVLLAAKKKHYIHSVKAELDKMSANGYRLSAALQKKLLALAGEEQSP